MITAPKLTYAELERQIREMERLLAARESIGRELKKGHDLYQKMFDHADVAIGLTDARTGKVTACNRKAWQELGYTEAEYLNLTHMDHATGDLQEDVKKIFANGASTYITRIRKKDGSVMDAFISSVLVKIKGKSYVHGIRVDITEQKKAERLVRQREEKYRSILDNMEEGYFEVDLAGDFTFCHKASIRIYGYPPEELIGVNFSTHMTSENAKKVYRFFNEVYRSGNGGKTFCYEIIRKDGSVRTLETSVSLMKDRSGEIVGFRGIARDITEQKMMENTLADSEEFYRSLFDHAGFGLVLIDARSGKRLAYNKMAYTQLGYTEEEYKTRGSLEMVASGLEIAEFRKALTENGYFSCILKLKTKSGEIRDFFHSVVKLEVGGRTGFQAIRFDVTDRKKTERILKESEARFKTIFESAVDAIFIFDLEQTRITSANPAACRYLGVDNQELLNLSMQDLIDPEYLAGWNDWLESLKETGIGFLESVFVGKNGSRIFVEISSRISEHNAKEIVLSIVRDVTERKKAANQLARYRENLEALVRERGEKLAAAQNELVKQEKMAVLGRLTATVSRELRNPLEIIQSSHNYLDKKITAKDDKIRKHLNRIDEQIRICDVIVADLVEYTRGDRLEGDSAEITHWLIPLVNRISETEKVKIRKIIQKGLPEIYHDRIKLQRVVINLLDNAIQAVRARAGECGKEEQDYIPEIGVSVESRGTGIVMKISDNGIGMDQKTQEKAFEPLFTTRARGTGLGLANAHKIVNEHGGEIVLRSKPGQGTDLSIFLPIRNPGI